MEQQPNDQLTVAGETVLQGMTRMENAPPLADQSIGGGLNVKGMTNLAKGLTVGGDVALQGDTTMEKKISPWAVINPSLAP